MALRRAAPDHRPQGIGGLRRGSRGAPRRRGTATSASGLTSRCSPSSIPVETGLVELGRLEELVLEQTAIARPASDTPSGTGVGAGTLVAVEELDGPPRSEPVVPVVPARIDYEDAAGRLREARAAGWNVTAAVVEADDAVLIGNRFDRSLPIVDEVADTRVASARRPRRRRGGRAGSLGRRAVRPASPRRPPRLRARGGSRGTDGCSGTRRPPRRARRPRAAKRRDRICPDRAVDCPRRLRRRREAPRRARLAAAAGRRGRDPRIGGRQERPTRRLLAHTPCAG